ncbi:hypothetical protein LR48_Vigan07g244100 [Vigna angularis]|uniref:Uncharacterized protein n=1 Tax=Phaseolus angularis TaxID=3914 RepID=A0A0L9V1J3_PHAAN|nr:hypothetical protein LR48_Vigan07g244100 [Vigna angularis]
MAATQANDPRSIVSISKVVSVNPKLVQPQRVLPLSNLDRQCPHLMHLVFFYNNLPHQRLKDLSLNSVFCSLKSGLEDTLALWYPAAGRLWPNQSDSKLNLWCNNHGAVLAEAETSAKISQLGNLSEYNEFFEKLVYKPAFDGNFSNMPLIVAQVTKFGCGGYSIGIGTSHSLFDGPATYEFLRAWASNSEIVKGRSRSDEVPKPVHERGMLLSGTLEAARETGNFPSDTSSNSKEERAMAVDHLYNLIMQTACAQKGFPLQIGTASNSKKCVLKTYHVSGAMTENLKRKHFPMQRGSFPFSTFEVLAAHLWKVTKFGCGGYSIGIGTSHSLFDGPATYEFLRAWASNSEIVKGRSRSDEVPKPVHERGMLLSGTLEAARETGNFPSDTSSNSKEERAMAVDHLYNLIMQTACAQKGFPLQIGTASNSKKCVLKTYHVSGAMTENLKRKHFPMQRGSFPFSTFEVLAAHLWKARSKALGVKKEKQVCLQFAVDIRNKTRPPLPKCFSGNAYVLASIMMPMGELENASHESIIEKIREAKNKVNHDYVRSYVEALEGAEQGSSLPPLKELTLVSDWTRMPFHNIQFFHGKPTYASPLATPIPQVAYFMQSPTDNNAVDVRIGLEAEHISAFNHCFLTMAS